MDSRTHLLREASFFLQKELAVFCSAVTLFFIHISVIHNTFNQMPRLKLGEIFLGFSFHPRAIEMTPQNFFSLCPLFFASTSAMV